MKLTLDGLRSLFGNLGNEGRDKNAGLEFDYGSINDEQLINAYTTNWIARKIVDIPARDSLRKWRVWSGDNADAMELEEKRLDVPGKLLETLIKARLFGGAALYIGTNQRPEEELNVDALKAGGIEYLNVMTRCELNPGDIERDPFSPYFGKPKNYLISGETAQAEIHPSRLVIFGGDKKADAWRAAGFNIGWDESVLRATFDTIKNAGGSFSNVASLIFEANVDVIGVPNMMAQIGNAGYESELLKRFQLAALGKGINGTLLMDAEETYERRSASFAQLPDLMREFALHCACLLYTSPSPRD